MRASLVLGFGLALLTSAFAAPLTNPRGPAIYIKDPDSVQAPSIAPHEDVCAEVCAVKHLDGRSERESLCSVEGMQATLDCATCIDTTWPDTTWEDSATAEYERISEACQDLPQQTFRRGAF